MGLFGKLFEKKECSICGGEIGLLGNKKLEDGNLCKTCANKLSPFFSDRRHSTVEEIRQQLAYREENANQLASFSPTQCFGLSYKKIRIDQNQGKFIISSANDWKNDNPDIISFTQVNSCTIDIDENRRELYRKDNEGRSVSYTPPRYEYSYRFYVELNVNSPYFDDIRFELSGSEADSPYSPAYQESEREAYGLKQAMAAFNVNVNIQGGNFNNQQGGFNNGYNNMPNNGFNNGYNNMPNNGFNNGYNNMPNNGYNNGYNNMPNNGFNNGYNNMPNNGYNNGYNNMPNNGYNQQGGFGGNAPNGAFAGAAMGAMGAGFGAAGGSWNWTCECGNLNQSQFCSNCGKQKTQYSPYKCDKCGWELQSMNVPSCCPVCGDAIDANDIN